MRLAQLAASLHSSEAGPHPQLKPSWSAISSTALCCSSPSMAYCNRSSCRPQVAIFRQLCGMA